MLREGSPPGRGAVRPRTKESPGMQERRNAMPEPFAIEELDSQVVAELPDREMLTLVVIRNLSILSNNRIDVRVQNNDVAVQVCALVNAIDALTLNNLNCRIRQ
jgi:hypothetical protein